MRGTRTRSGQPSNASARALRLRCQERLSQLDVPDPFDLAVFLDRLQRSRARRIVVVPYRFDVPGAPCGLWVPLPDADVVFVEEATTGVARDNIVAHEIGHLLADHDADPALVRAYRARLFPHLDPGVVERVLGRTSYTAEQEQEAEVFAWLLLGGRAIATEGGAGRGATSIDRAQQLFGGSV